MYVTGTCTECIPLTLKMALHFSFDYGKKYMHKNWLRRREIRRSRVYAVVKPVIPMRGRGYFSVSEEEWEWWWCLPSPDL